MKKKQFRMMAILWLIGTIILQSIPAYAQNDEIGLRSSSSSFQYSVFELRNMTEWQKVIGVTVNEEEYQKVSEKSELSQGKKYHLPDAGFLEPKVYISKLKKDDIVKFITTQGYLQVKINNPDGMFGIHDKKSVKFVVKPKDPKPEEPAEPAEPEITLLVKYKWNNDFIAEILPTPKEGEVRGIEIDGEPYEKGNFKYSHWNNPKTYYLENGDLYLFEPAEGAVLTLTYANGKKYSFKYLKSERKFEPLKNSDPNQPNPNDPQQPNPNDPQQPNPNDPQQPNPNDPQQPQPNDPQQPNPNTSAPVLTPYVPAAETETRPTVPHAAAKEEIKQPEMKKEDDSTSGTEELTENQIPEGAVAETQNIPATISEKMVDAEEMKETPLPLGAPELPKTAGIPAESLCLFGLGAAIVGFWLKRQK